MADNKDQEGGREEKAKVTKLYWDSFNLSQGDDAIQQLVLYWLYKKGQFTPELYVKYKDDLGKMRPPKKAHKPIGTNDLEINEAIEATHSGNRINIAEIFTGEEPYLFRTEPDPALKGDESLPLVLAQQIISRDYYFIRMKRGRPRPDGSEEDYSSHFREYILNKNWDELSPELHPLLEEMHKLAAEKKEAIGGPIELLIGRWEEKHPGQKFFPANENQETS